MLVMGRTVGEYGEVRKRLAALLAEAERHGNTFQAMVHYLKGSQYGGEAGLRYAEKCPDLSSLPTAEQLRKLAEETIAAIAQKRELGAKLKEFGVEPKE